MSRFFKRAKYVHKKMKFFFVRMSHLIRKCVIVYFTRWQSFSANRYWVDFYSFSFFNRLKNSWNICVFVVETQTYIFFPSFASLRILLLFFLVFLLFFFYLLRLLSSLRICCTMAVFWCNGDALVAESWDVTSMLLAWRYSFSIWL